MMNAVRTTAIVSAKATTARQVIEIFNLRKGFGQQEVIKNVSLKLHDGENLVVLGKSGSGKSVLIK
jgi:phospholipid/cholesterol/gamma-HCH transport system ATP-binding protein